MLNHASPQAARGAAAQHSPAAAVVLRTFGCRSPVESAPCLLQRAQAQSPSTSPNAQPLSSHSAARPASRLVLRRAFEGAGRDVTGGDDYVEVKVDSVRVSQGASVVFLRILDGGSRGNVLPVHIGETESNALLKEINKQKQLRPLTHDVMKNILSTLHFRVSRIRITDIVANTYYARIHLARINTQGQIEADTEVEVDARPSDAINLAVRFGAPMFVNRKIAESACASPPEVHMLNTGGAGGSAGSGATTSSGETHAEIARSVREMLANFEDPTIMYQLQKDLAIQEQRYEDAQKLQQQIFDQMMHNPMLRLVVAMEAALGDGRYEEAAKLRDEYRKLLVAASSSPASGGEQRRA